MGGPRGGGGKGHKGQSHQSFCHKLPDIDYLGILVSADVQGCRGHL